jgi:uncharacterized delta-60 repeat protein
LAAGLLASAATAGSDRSVGVVPVSGPSSAKGVVAYGSTRLLLFEPAFPGPPGVTRVRPNGSVDRSFGEGGTVKISAEGVAVAPKGRVLVATASNTSESAKSSKARVTRLLPNGRRDPSFGVGGSASVDFGGRYDYGKAVAVAPDGDILLAGLSDYSIAVARIEPDGSLDRSFGRNGGGEKKSESPMSSRLPRAASLSPQATKSKPFF